MSDLIHNAAHPRIGSLFSGYGGLDMAAQEVFGGTIAWNCDNDKGASTLLAHHWPDVPNLGDITNVNWSHVEPVDIITAGSPCQDVSVAGARRGMHEGTRSNLWVAARDAIDALRPSLFIWENVRGVLSSCAHSDMGQCRRCVGEATGKHDPALRALGRVLGDLADIGYDATWHGLRASDVGAPHQRFRVFLLAWPADARGGGRNTRRTTAGGEEASRGTLGIPTRCGLLSASDGLVEWGEYAIAINRWESLTRPAPRPTAPGVRTGKPQLNPEFSEWMMGLPAGHVTGVPGLSRSKQLQIIGNGVCPQQAVAALERTFPRATSHG